MTKSNIEQIWIDAWNEVADFESLDFVLINQEDQRPVSSEHARELIQSFVYSGFYISFSKGWYAGKKAIFIAKGDRVCG